MPRLAGKVAFITGAGNGIGRATAILFACQGAKVAIGEIDTQAGEETAHLAGNEAIAIRADVTDSAEILGSRRTRVSVPRARGDKNSRVACRRYAPLLTRACRSSILRSRSSS